MVSIELNDDSGDWDEGSTIPKPSMYTAQPAVGSEDPEETSTFRLDIQPPWDGSRSIRETVEGPDESLIENCSNTIPTGSEEERRRLDAPSPDTQLGLVPEAPRPFSLGSTMDGLLWDPEGAGIASPTSHYSNEAGELNTGELDEENGVFFLIQYESGEEVQGDGTGAVHAPKGRGPMRKRTWPETSSPLSLTRSFTHPHSSVEQRRAVSKGSPAYKRSKRARI